MSIRSTVDALRENGKISLNEAKVGAFYIIKGKIYSQDVDLRQGESYGDFVNYASHWDLWDYVVSRIPTLSHVDYDYFPRGRVVFKKSMNKYIIYLDPKLNNPSDISKITQQYNLASGSYIINIKDEHYKSFPESRLYEDDFDLDKAEQRYTSAKTSINSSKLPAIYKLVNFRKGGVVLDYGGGKFDNGIAYLASLGVQGYVYDPFNRSAEYNNATVAAVRKNGGADTILLSNVLNVIQEPQARKTALQNCKRLLKSSGTLYITVYEGNSTGSGTETSSGYQLNRKTPGYLEEIQVVFPNAVRKGKLIIAR